MVNRTIRERLDAYVKEKYGIDPEILPFSHEDYEIYRHEDIGKWFAVFIVKERSAFGLDGDGEAEILCVKPKDRFFADFMMQQKGFPRGFPSSKWNWMSMVLDGTVPFEDICRWLDRPVCRVISCFPTRIKSSSLTQNIILIPHRRSMTHIR